MLTRITASVFVSVFLASCLPIGLDETDPSLTGIWGGEHIVLDISSESAAIEYDCAYGTIDEAIVVNNGGTFEAGGTHVFEHGGPIREDEVPDVHPARYSGMIRGSNMTLTVNLTDTAGPELGPYQLERGTAGRVFKCL